MRESTEEEDGVSSHRRRTHRESESATYRHTVKETPAKNSYLIVGQVKVDHAGSVLSMPECEEATDVWLRGHVCAPTTHPRGCEKRER
jgi:hypothetical protein